MFATRACHSAAAPPLLLPLITCTFSFLPTSFFLLAPPPPPLLRISMQAQHLLNAADYFTILRLQSFCERYLADNLAVGNAAFTLALADQHGAVLLRECAARFIAVKAAEVIKTEGWSHLEGSHPTLAHKLLKFALAGDDVASLFPSLPAAAGGGAPSSNSSS